MKMTLLVCLGHSRTQLSHTYVNQNDYTKRGPAIGNLIEPLK